MSILNSNLFCDDCWFWCQLKNKVSGEKCKRRVTLRKSDGKSAEFEKKSGVAVTLGNLHDNVMVAKQAHEDKVKGQCITGENKVCLCSCVFGLMFCFHVDKHLIVLMFDFI